MKEVTHNTPVSDMGAACASQAQDLLKSHIAPAVRSTTPVAVVAHTPAQQPGLLAKAMGMLGDLLKGQVKGYTKADGTLVKPHSTTVVKGAGDIPGGGIWKKGHQVKLHAPGHNLHGFSGTLTGGSQKDGHSDMLHVQGKDATQAINVHDLRPAEGHGWPDVETGDQPVREPAAPAVQPIKKPAGKGIPKQADPKAAAAAGAALRDGSALKPQKKAKPAGGGASLADEAAAAGAPAPEKPVSRGTAAPAAAPGGSPAPEHLEAMADQLANNEEGDDDELVETMQANGVPEHHAKAAIAHRAAFSQAGPGDQTPAKLGEMMAAAGGGAAKPPEGAGGADAAAGGAPAVAGAGGGAVPPHADANAAGWDKLPDDENPQHALSGMGSKELGRLATMKPEHAKAYAHKELANRGQDSSGSWQGFDKANAHHAGDIPEGFQPDDVNEGDGGITGHMQTVHGKVLQAAAQGHLDLQQRARAQLAGRGHDTNGSWVGFQKANELHGVDGKTGQPLAKKPGGSKPAAGAKDDGNPLFKALQAGERPMFFVAMEQADGLHAAMGGKP